MFMIRLAFEKNRLGDSDFSWDPTVRSGSSSLQLASVVDGADEQLFQPQQTSFVIAAAHAEPRAARLLVVKCIAVPSLNNGENK